MSNGIYYAAIYADGTRVSRGVWFADQAAAIASAEDAGELWLGLAVRDDTDENNGRYLRRVISRDELDTPAIAA